MSSLGSLGRARRGSGEVPAVHGSPRLKRALGMSATTGGQRSPKRALFAGLVCVAAATAALWMLAGVASAEPVAPVVGEEWVEGVSDSTATVSGEVNPQGSATAYRFEYGPDASYGSSAPVPDGSAGSGEGLVTVSQNLSGLAADTTYHYRFVATSANGTTTGPDKTFKTFPAPSVVTDACPNAQIRGLQAAQFLPDCRAYEMVSPIEKDGGNVSASPTNTRAAVDGNAVQYVSVTGFADAHGSASFGTDYIAQRIGEGWVTHAITPSQTPPDFLIARVANYAGDFSDDLNTGVFLSVSPLEPIEPNVANVPNLYLRTDLLKAGQGAYRLLSACAECEQPLPARPFLVFSEVNPALAGVSDDFSHVLFESTDDLARATFGFGRHPKLYESVDGAVRSAGVLPDGSVAEESVAGQGAIEPGEIGGLGRSSMYTPHTISADGSRIVFTAGPLITGNEIGIFSPGYAGNLYLRENGTATVKLNTSELSVPESEQPAMFLNASRDDSKIFFETAERLTDEDTHPGLDLYMYDTNAPEHERLTLITRSVPVGESNELLVPGVSEDGSYVYFVTGRSNERTLYVWHDGSARLITYSNHNPSWGGEAAYRGNQFRVSPDGRHVILTSTSPQAAESVGYDNQRDVCENGACAEVYTYDYVANKLTCMSCDPSGERPVGDAGFISNSSDITIIGLAKTHHLNRALTADGSKVFFDTPDALLRQDTNGKRDVYEYDTLTGKISLISSGRSTDDSFFVEATPNGSDVFFITSEQLVKAEVDGNFDLYDAREDGGLASQNLGPAAQCESDDCQGPAKTAPTFSQPSSLTFQGAGNPVPRTVVGPRAKHLNGPARLKRALRACRRRHGRQRRRRCERVSHRRYRAVKSSSRTVIATVHER